jgi:outer membrane lipoprotein-sorting protein
MRRSGGFGWSPGLALLALCAAGLGCKPGPVARPTSLPAAPALLEEIRGRQARAWSLRGETKLDYWAPEGRTKVTVNMAVARPGKLRFEAENPISGHTEGTLVTDGRNFALLDVQHNRFLVGPALPCNVARMTRIDMPPDDVAVILLGSAPVLPHERAEVGWDPADGGREVLTLALPGGATERLEIANKSRDLVAAEVKDSAGRSVWRLTHEDFGNVGGVRRPRRTKFVEPREQADVIIRFKDVDVNVAIPEDVFHLSPPPGMVARPTGCAPAESVAP